MGPDITNDMHKTGPSTSQWAAHRHTVIELYKCNTLKEVDRVMREKHGFHASKRMYDRRLKAWGIAKNLKSAKKDQIVSMLVQSGTWASGTSPSRARHLSIDARDHAKVMRYVKSKSRSPTSSPSAVPGRNRPKIHKSSPTQPRYRNLSTSVLEAEPWTIIASPDISPRLSLEDNLLSHTMQLSSSLGSSDSSSASQGWLSNRISPWRSPDDEIELGDEEPAGPRTNSQACLNFDFVLFPPPSIPCDAKSVNLEKMLRSINMFLPNISSPYRLDAQWFADKIPSERLSPSHTFWSELKYGIYLLKINSLELAWPALDKACDLAPTVLKDHNAFDFVFLKELFLTLSPVNTRILPKIRLILVQYLSYLAHLKLGAHHPVAVICHELQQDDHNREVSEQALACMLNVVSMHVGATNMSDMALQLETSIICVLRRDGDYEGAARKARALFRRTQSALPAFSDFGATGQIIRPLNQARLAATAFAHLRMDQRGEHYDEAIELCLFVLTGKMQNSDVDDSVWPPSPSMLEDIIPDKKSTHTLEDLAKVYEELQDIDGAIEWLEKAEILASRVYGSAEESSATAHIVDKLKRLRHDGVGTDALMSCG